MCISDCLPEIILQRVGVNSWCELNLVWTKISNGYRAHIMGFGITRKKKGIVYLR